MYNYLLGGGGQHHGFSEFGENRVDMRPCIRYEQKFFLRYKIYLLMKKIDVFLSNFLFELKKFFSICRFIQYLHALWLLTVYIRFAHIDINTLITALHYGFKRVIDCSASCRQFGRLPVVHSRAGSDHC